MDAELSIFTQTHIICKEAKPPTCALSSPPIHVRNTDEPYFCRARPQFEEERGEEPVLLLAQSTAL